MSQNLPTIVVTGGAGFIGSAVCRHLVLNRLANVINLDCLTYAANLASLKSIEDADNYTFVKVDICDSEALSKVFQEHKPDGVMHLAAESHVDRSITGAAEFINTNVIGTFNMLDAAKEHWLSLEGDTKSAFKFLHVSTDEVYGSLGEEGLFTEETAYDPSSPYSASKAASDHLAIAWNRTYGLPVVISNCSNNYGPCHFPEKLIPLIILNCLHHKPLPIYGKGDNVRDWLYVEDHAKALFLIWRDGQCGDKYNVGGRNERTNIEVVKKICQLMDKHSPNPLEAGHESLITYVTDRPGHDARYAIDADKLEGDLGWKAEENFDTGIEKTVKWYLENQDWWQPILDNNYSMERLGL
jgi:dTDP-glucose 4,6-dehydratase